MGELRKYHLETRSPGTTGSPSMVDAAVSGSALCLHADERYPLMVCQKRSGMLVNAILVGAAERASSMLAENSVAVPYF